MVSFQIVVDFLVIIFMASLRHCVAHSNLVGCPIPMQICGHFGLVFQGAGVLHLQSSNVTLECGSSVGPNMNFTIIDTNTSGMVKYLIRALRNPVLINLGRTGNFLIEVTGGIIPGGTCGQSRILKRNSTVTTPSKGKITLQVKF